MDKETKINILLLLCENIQQRFDELESEGIIFHKPKMKGKAFMKELEKISSIILEDSKEINPEAYKKALNKFHEPLLKLDDFLESLINEPL